LVPQIVKSQVFPLPEQNPEWIVSTSSTTGVFEERYTLTGDLLSSDGEEWPIVQRTSLIDFQGLVIARVLNVGAYYVDGDKVRYKDFGFGESEGLMYDFSAEIGDTFFIVAPFAFSLDSVEVTVTDREITNCDDGGTERTIYLSTTSQSLLDGQYDFVWKEGFGEVEYPFLRRQCLDSNCDIFYEGSVLISEGDTIVVGDNNGCLTSDEYLTLEELPTLNIYPNPVYSRSINLRIEGGAFNGAVVGVKVLDQLGRLVRKSEERIIEGVVASVDLHGLKSGSYFIVLTQGSGFSLTKRLVVVD
jgi:hypothetical protein